MPLPATVRSTMYPMVPVSDWFKYSVLFYHWWEKFQVFGNIGVCNLKAGITVGDPLHDTSIYPVLDTSINLSCIRYKYLSSLYLIQVSIYPVYWIHKYHIYPVLNTSIYLSCIVYKYLSILY